MKCWMPLFLVLAAAAGAADVSVFEDHFAAMPSGIVMGVVGAAAEYHYLPACAPVKGWAVSAYKSDPASQRAWRIVDDGGQRAAAMVYANKAKDMHPLLVAGDPLWQDYTVRLRFVPEENHGWCGVVFRCHNDRSCYFFGLDGPKAVLRRVNQGKAFRELNIDTLAEAAFDGKTGEYREAVVTAAGDHIRAELVGGPVLEAQDATFGAGGIGLLADQPSRFTGVGVTMTEEAQTKFEAAKAQHETELRELQAANPKPVVWRKFNIDGYGVGRNLRFGDLDGDGQLDILFGQVEHHGPKDANSEVSCLTAVNFEGKVLWQIGAQDPWKETLTNDVAFQIHDLDGDGRNEVVYCMNQEIVVAEGATGKTLRKAPLPESPKDSKKGYNKYSRILGDSMLFCDTRGTGRAADVVVKDRYTHFWVLDDQLKPLWDAACNTGHYPYAMDVDGDGKDEIAIGYSLYDHDGTLMWSLDKELQDHCDGVAIVKTHAEDAQPRLLIAGSDEGMLQIDLQGKIMSHLFLGHVQNPGTADFRSDLPGLETVTVNFWGNQGIIHIFDADGKLLADFEPFQHGSLCQPINWTGRQGEYVALSVNPDDGGLWDGRGRRVVRFPADGHPDMCYAVLDVTSDCRDEIVVWDPNELWVYTQDDSPKPGRLYKPVRNPLYNESNYRASVSLPGWNDTK